MDVYKISSDRKINEEKGYVKSGSKTNSTKDFLKIKDQDSDNLHFHQIPTSSTNSSEVITPDSNGIIHATSFL